MLIGYNTPLRNLDSLSVTRIEPSQQGVTTTLDAQASPLIDGNPGTVERLTVGADTGAGGEKLIIDAEYGLSGIPRIAALLNTTLPAGTLVSIEYGETSSSWGYQQQSARVQVTPNGRRNLWMVWPAGLNGVVRVRVIIYNDVEGGGSLNQPAYDIGQLWVSPAWEPPFGVRRDWPTKWVDPSDPAATLRGDVFDFPAEQYREMSLRFGRMPFDVAYGPNGLAAIRPHLAKGQRCAILPRPTTTEALHATSIFGHVSDPGSIQHQGGDYFDSALTVRELVG